MHGIRRKYIATVAILLFPLLTLFLPGNAKEALKLNFVSVFRLPLANSNDLSDRLQQAVSPKGFFSRRLKAQHLLIQTLKAENSQLKEAYLENKRLKELFIFKDGLVFHNMPAQVIAKDPANWRHNIIINKGSGDGLRKNMFLISSEGLVGRIIETGRTISKAILLTDPDFRVAAVVSRSREQAIVSGTGGGLCIMKYLPQDADVQINDVVVTSGLGGFSPKGILIGEVRSVRKSQDGLTLEAHLKPSAHLNRVEEALVLIE